jgi:predicted GNAT family acetyltransferase
MNFSAFLHTKLANGTANRIYQAIGYQPITDAVLIRIDP